MRISAIEAARATRRQPLGNGAIQLLLYVGFGALLPPLAWFARAPRLLVQSTGANTLVAITIAAVASWFVLFRLRSYAKARRLSYVVPVNVLTFGLGAAVVGGLRRPAAR